MTATAKRLIITGHVQGVGYRAAFAALASSLGVSGWVRNRRDNSVEACISGDANAIDTLVTWARRGPPAARVENVQITDSEEPAARDGKFRIAPTQ
jgi:acylphosphatase